MIKKPRRMEDIMREAPEPVIYPPEPEEAATEEKALDVQQTTYFEDPDPLALDPKWVEEHKDANRQYQWLRKDSTLSGAIHRGGWKKESEHPDTCFDLVLCSRPMEAGEAETRQLEAENRRREGLEAHTEFSQALSGASSRYNVPVEDLLLRGVGRNGPVQRAGEDQRRRFYSIPK